MHEEQSELLGKRSPLLRGGQQQELFSSKCFSELSQEESLEKCCAKQSMIQDTCLSFMKANTGSSQSTQASCADAFTSFISKLDVPKSSEEKATEVSEENKSRLPPDLGYGSEVRDGETQLITTTIDPVFPTCSRSTSGVSAATIELSEKHCSRNPSLEKVAKNEGIFNEVEACNTTRSEQYVHTLDSDQFQKQQTPCEQERSPMTADSTSEESQEMTLESLLASLEPSAQESVSAQLSPQELKLFKLSNNTESKFQSRLEKAAEHYASIHAGTYAPAKVRFMMLFTFRCCLNHKFELTSHEVLTKKWCGKCDDLWIQLAKTAKKKDSTIVDKSISPLVNMRCMRNHLFTVKPSE